MSNIYYVIFTCCAYEDSRKVMQEKYLLPNKKYIYVSKDTKKNKNIIGFGTPDDYLNLPLKYINFFKHYYNNVHLFNCDWFFLCDDDCYWNEMNMNKLLSNFKINEPVSIGQLSCNYNGIINYCGGAGIILNKLSMDIISKYLIDNNISEYYPYSDVTLSKWLIDLGIDMINSNQMFSQHYNHYNHTIDDVKKSISYHYIKDESDFIYLNSVV